MSGFCGCDRSFHLEESLLYIKGQLERVLDENEALKATIIKRRLCPFGRLEEGQSMAHCPSGFPGCACGDEIQTNKYLQDMLDGSDKTGV